VAELNLCQPLQIRRSPCERTRICRDPTAHLPHRQGYPTRRQVNQFIHRHVGSARVVLIPTSTQFHRAVATERRAHPHPVTDLPALHWGKKQAIVRSPRSASAPPSQRHVV